MNKSSEYTKFVEVLQRALKGDSAPDCVLKAEEWRSVYERAMKQGVAGILWPLFERSVCATENRDDQWYLLLLRRSWEKHVQECRSKNEALKVRCFQVQENFRARGFYTLMYKGQAVAHHYPEPMLREPGDIDVLVWPMVSGDLTNTNLTNQANLCKEGRDNLKTNKANLCKVGLKERRERIAEYVIAHSKRWPAIHYLHMEFPLPIPESIEVHFTASFLTNPFDDHRMQRLYDVWYPREVRDMSHVDGLSDTDLEQIMARGGFREIVACPSLRFEAVFCLAHMYRHLLMEGIGLRQMVDFYFILKTLLNPPLKGGEVTFNSDETRSEVMETITHVGMRRFCAATMYVMHEVLGLPSEYLLCEPDVRCGRQLVREIFEGGNFGRESEAVQRSKASQSALMQHIYSMAHTMRHLFYYPSEVLWMPYFMVLNSIERNKWRRRENLH